MNFTIRSVLLLNDDNELLLLHVNDPKTTPIDGKHHGPFWCLVGGKIEPYETIQEAAMREIYEETGMKKEEIELGPIVWFGEFDFVLAGTPTHQKEIFIVAKSTQKNVSLANLTPEEQTVIKKAAWFSLEKIKNSTDFSRILPVAWQELYAPNRFCNQHACQLVYRYPYHQS